MSSYKN